MNKFVCLSFFILFELVFSGSSLAMSLLGQRLVRPDVTRKIIFQRDLRGLSRVRFYVQGRIARGPLSTREDFENLFFLSQSLTERAVKAQHAGQTCFSYREMSPVLSRIVADMKSRLEDRVDSESYRLVKPLSYRPRLEALLMRAAHLEEAHLPYGDFVQFVFDWLRLVDEDVRRAKNLPPGRASDPELDMVIRKTNETIPYCFLYFILDEDIPLSRINCMLGAQMMPIGLKREFSLADGYKFSPFDYAAHDYDHAIVCSEARSSLQGKSSTAFSQFQLSHMLYDMIELLRLKKPDLAGAVDQVLFNIVHEVGRPYTLSELEGGLKAPRCAHQLPGAPSFELSLRFEARDWLLRAVRSLSTNIETKKPNS